MRICLMVSTTLFCFIETYLFNLVFPPTIGVPLSVVVAIAIAIIVITILESKEPLT
jgi:hypothetical protein